MISVTINTSISGHKHVNSLFFSRISLSFVLLGHIFWPGYYVKAYWELGTLLHSDMAFDIALLNSLSIHSYRSSSGIFNVHASIANFFFFCFGLLLISLCESRTSLDAVDCGHVHGSLLVFFAEALTTIKVWLPGGAGQVVGRFGVVFSVDWDG